MDPLWLSLSLIHDGLPCLSPLLVLSPVTYSPIDIRMMDWPTKKDAPVVASKRSHLLNYGSEHFEVSICHSHAPLAGLRNSHFIFF